MISRLNPLSTPVTHTRAVPVVRAKNTHASHASCSATSTTVTVMRLRMRLKKFDDRQSEQHTISPFRVSNTVKYNAVFPPLQAFGVGYTGVPAAFIPYKKFTGASADAPVNRNHSIIFSAQTVGASLSS